jgi:signal transduction histidine kinase
MDALLALALAVTLLGTVVALAGSWGGLSWLLDLAAGVVTGSLALRRPAEPPALIPGGRRWAYAVAASAVAVGAILAAWLAHLPHEPGPATVLALAVLLASAIRHDGPRRAALPAGCGLAVVVVAGLCSHPYAGSLDLITVLAALGWLTAVAAGLGLRLRDAQRRAVLDEVRRHERLDLARELHDLAAHHLTGLVLASQAARVVARTDPTRIDDSLAGIETAGSDALTAVRRVVGLLRDASDAAPTGPPSLAELIQNFTARPGAPAVRTEIDENELSPEVRDTVYRIVQEALTNVVRHAPHARTVDIAVRETAVTVTDDGPAQALRGGGYGLIGMAERVHALGGVLEAGPRTGGGWEVRASL